MYLLETGHATALERWSPREVNTEQEEENLGSAWDKWDFLHREGS
jgi:hypothetical protein